jgi:SAM-dependent methyltransferase
MAANTEDLTNVDDSFEDEAYNSSTTTAVTSYETSIASYIRDGVEENGRKYPAYGKNMYGLPIDEREQERNDLQHDKFSMIIGGHLHLAPIGDSPSKILDLGTGSGIWAIQAADIYESAIVTGVDVAPVQPNWVPPNCRFEVLDIEDDWLFAKSSFDLVHARELIMSIRDWSRLFEQGLDHLRPGGYFEVGGSYPVPTSDDHTLPKHSYLKEAEKLFFEMGEVMGTPVDAPKTWRETMERAGFIDVQETIFKVPQGVWPKDKTLKKIGAFENHSLTTGLEAYLMRGYTQILGGRPEELQVIVAKARDELRNPKIHSYIF